MCGNYYLIKGNPERLKKESDRVSSYLNDKYKNDEEFREKKREYAREYRRRKSLEKKLAEQSQTEVLKDAFEPSGRQTECMPDIILG